MGAAMQNADEPVVAFAEHFVHVGGTRIRYREGDRAILWFFFTAKTA
jgi:hypothetical protein